MFHTFEAFILSGTAGQKRAKTLRNRRGRDDRRATRTAGEPAHLTRPERIDFERVFYPAVLINSPGEETTPTMNPDLATQEQAQTSATEASSAAGETASTPGDASAETGQAEPAKPQRSRTRSTARKTRAIELTLTVTGTADGEWQAELKHGSRWVARGLEIPASAVSRAAKELHDELSVPIDEVINAAKEQQQAKVAQLEAELEQAKQALAELER